MAPHERMTPESFAVSLRLIHLISQPENQQLLAAGETPLSTHLTRLCNCMVKTNLLSSAVDTTGMRADRFVKGSRE